MILQSRDFSAFELRVAGYQFPDIESAEFDANWLVVEGLVAPADERAWKFRDPALLTWEVEDLCNWLEAVASGQDVEESADFMEPNLRFEVAERDQDTITILGLLRAGITAALVVRRRRGHGRFVDRSSRGRRPSP